MSDVRSQLARQVRASGERRAAHVARGLEWLVNAASTRQSLHQGMDLPFVEGSNPICARDHILVPSSATFGGVAVMNPAGRCLRNIGGALTTCGGVAVVGDEVYVSDRMKDRPGEGRVVVFEWRSGKQLRSLKRTPDSGFFDPGCVAASQGHLFVSEREGNCVSILTLDRATFVRGVEVERPAGIAVEGDLLFVTSSPQNCVYVFNWRNGERRRVIGHPGSSDGELLRPAGVCSHEGLLFVADSSNSRIAVFSHAGAFVANITGRATDDYFSGSLGARNGLPNVRGVCVSEDGDLFATNHNSGLMLLPGAIVPRWRADARIHRRVSASKRLEVLATLSLLTTGPDGARRHPQALIARLPMELVELCLAD